MLKKLAKPALNVSAQTHADISYMLSLSFIIVFYPDVGKSSPKNQKPESVSNMCETASLVIQRHICASAVSCIYLLTDNQYKYTLRMLMGISHRGISITGGIIALLVCANTTPRHIRTAG